LIVVPVDVEAHVQSQLVYFVGTLLVGHISVNAENPVLKIAPELCSRPESKVKVFPGRLMASSPILSFPPRLLASDHEPALVPFIVPVL
jgi:hypothetical protein